MPVAPSAGSLEQMHFRAEQAEREQRKIQQVLAAVFTMRFLCRPGAAVPYTAVVIIFQRLIGLRKNFSRVLLHQCRF